MATYYIEDKNGKYASIKGTRRFKKLSGQKALEYLKTPEGKKKRFMVTDHTRDGDNSVFVELRKQDIKGYRKDERRTQYLKDCEVKAGYTIVPIYTCSNSEGEECFSGEELIADDTTGIVDDYIRNEEIELLRKAIATLKPEERDLIIAFFYRNKTPTEKEYGDEIGMSQASVHRLKEKILKKIKNFL